MIKGNKVLLAVVSILTLVTMSMVEAQNRRPSAAQPKRSVHDTSSGQGYGTAGCGLGSIVFGDKPGMIQIVAATLNGTAGNQTFGITSGTSNCASNEGHSSAAAFINVNKVALQNDISRGGGETVVSLSKIMGCQESENLGPVLQSNYGKIFPNTDVKTEEIRDSIFGVVKTESGVVGPCSQVM